MKRFICAGIGHVRYPRGWNTFTEQIYIMNRKKIRLPGYDYSNPGAYYVTMNVHNRVCVFGDVINRKMNLNEWGLIIEKQWEWLFKHYRYLKSDEYIIMPDHFHGIVNISYHISEDFEKIKPLPELIGAFKTTSSKLIHLSGNRDFRWQRSYYDRIIREDKELYYIRKYIRENPERWEKYNTWFWGWVCNGISLCGSDVSGDETVSPRVDQMYPGMQRSLPVRNGRDRSLRVDEIYCRIKRFIRVPDHVYFVCNGLPM